METRPTLYSDLQNDWNIFWDLCSRRKVDSMAGRMERISYLEIEAYMRIHDINNGVERTRLLDRIDFLDKIYCNHYNDKVK